MIHSAADPARAQNLWWLAVASGGLGLWSLYNLFRRLQRDRWVADTPLVRLRSAAQGYVRVIGRGAPAGAAALAAPLTARPCLWWSYDIAVHERDSRGNSHWRSIESGTSVDLFRLCDGDASCLVGPVHAEITPTSSDVWFGNGARPGAAPLKYPASFASDDYRFTEKLLADSVELCVLGELRSHSEMGTSDAAVAAKLHAWKADQAALLARFDANHDGKIDAAEWETVRAAARRETEAQALGTPIARTSIISEPVNGEPFLVAPTQGVDLVRREQRYALLYFALGLLCVTLCAWSLRAAHLHALAGS